jgi:hypothetical protein
MSLPAVQQRTLDAIADGLRRSEPRLAAMYGIFTRLCSSEALPSREQVSGSRGHLTWRSALFASHVVISFVVLLVLLGVSWHGSGGCGSASPQHVAAYVRLWCPSTAGPPVFPGK